MRACDWDKLGLGSVFNIVHTEVLPVGVEGLAKIDGHEYEEHKDAEADEVADATYHPLSVDLLAHLFPAELVFYATLVFWCVFIKNSDQKEVRHPF